MNRKIGKESLVYIIILLLSMLLLRYTELKTTALLVER